MAHSGLTGPPLHLRVLSPAQQQIAVPVALERIEERELRLSLRLHRLGLAEGRARLLDVARLVQRVGQGCSDSHPQKGVAAPIGQLDALLSVADGLGHVAGRQGQLAEVVGIVGPHYPNVG